MDWVLKRDINIYLIICNDIIVMIYFIIFKARDFRYIGYTQKKEGDIAGSPHNVPFCFALLFNLKPLITFFMSV